MGVRFQWMTGFSVGFFLFVNPLFANTTFEQVQVPQCLAAKISPQYQVLAEDSNFKIIEIPSAAIGGLARLADEVACGRFVNVSHHLVSHNRLKKREIASKLLLKLPRKLIAEPATDYDIKHQLAVKEALTKIDSKNIWSVLNHLTSFYNRSATQTTGLNAAEWLRIQFEEMATEHARRDTATYFVATGKHYQQPSLVTVIGKDIKAPAIVLGAHMDTLDGRMPGADDDASGSAIAMETARVLLQSSTPLKHPVYIIWYAAEERGLVGSQYVVRDFLKKAIEVKAVLQLDMAGYRYVNNDPTMWVFRDYTDKQLSHFIARLIKTYIQVPVAYSKCGYGCSDHASWTAEGIPAAFPCETSFANHNPSIHTPADTIDLMNNEHLINFAKLALAFSLELASE